MNVTPFLLVKRGIAELLMHQANAALARWCAAWASHPDSMVTCVAASHQHLSVSAGPDWHQRTLSNGKSVWILLSTGLQRSVEQILFGLDELDATSEKHLPSPIARGVAHDALKDLVAGLISEVTEQTLSSTSAPAGVPLPKHLFRPGSGAIVCTVTFAGHAIRLLLPADAIPAPPVPPNSAPRRAPLSTLHHALSQVPVKLSVEVSQSELTLGYLKTLAVGDVLVLPSHVDCALRVTSPGDTTVCHGHLGTLAGFHAIELIK